MIITRWLRLLKIGDQFARRQLWAKLPNSVTGLERAGDYGGSPAPLLKSPPNTKLMAHLIDTYTDPATMAEPFTGVKFQPEQVVKADRVEVWGSDFSEAGGDYCMYRLMKGESNVIAEIRRDGY